MTGETMTQEQKLQIKALSKAQIRKFFRLQSIPHQETIVGSSAYVGDRLHAHATRRTDVFELERTVLEVDWFVVSGNVSDLKDYIVIYGKRTEHNLQFINEHGNIRTLTKVDNETYTLNLSQVEDDNDIERHFYMVAIFHPQTRRSRTLFSFRIAQEESSSEDSSDELSED